MSESLCKPDVLELSNLVLSSQIIQNRATDPKPETVIILRGRVAVNTRRHQVAWGVLTTLAARNYMVDVPRVTIVLKLQRIMAVVATLCPVPDTL